MVIISIVPGIGCKDTGGLLVVMASPVKRTKLQSLRLWPISKLLPIPLWCLPVKCYCPCGLTLGVQRSVRSIKRNTYIHGC